MHIIRHEPPAVGGNTVTFRWSVAPATPLYKRTSFQLHFPDTVDVAQVPLGIWWRVALISLHPHWALLRPCRIVLPVRLGPGEREFWLRLCDAAVAALEARAEGPPDVARRIDIVEAGPALEPLSPTSEDSGLVAACFSGGRDSLLQTALLQELGQRPLLVTTTSPREASVEHETERRREVLQEITRRRGLELVEVHSDFRGCCENAFAVERYDVGVTETTDTLLFTSIALAVAVARGARGVFLASEAEVQETARIGGAIAGHRHFMFSGVTQRSIQALLEPTAIRYTGLTYPLQHFQIQRVLVNRFADLRDLQYSCWQLSAGQSACSRCTECMSIAFNVMSDGVAPSELGIDVATVLVAKADWRPGESGRGRGEASERAGELIDGQMLRCLERLSPERMAGFVEEPAALEAYAAMRAGALNGSVPPEPGYRDGFLELLDEPLRSGLRTIYREHFEPAPPESYAGVLERALTLSDWIIAPLRDPALDRRYAPRDPAPVRPVVVRPPAPAPLSDAELQPIRHLIPGAEPELVSTSERPALRVAETLLDGNEAKYVSECVETNWVSSTGSFVARFEAAFAAAAGCEFAVACSSGTTALHLALAAAGIGPGDEVILPAFTMIATANAVGYTGAKAVFVDTDPATWNVDLDRVVEAISPRTRAIVVMHTYGQPVDADAVQAIADRNGLVVIEDAAEAHGAEWRGRRVGSLGIAAAFSFYGNKIITTGEGGMVTSNDAQLAAVARELRDHGFSAERHFWHRFRAFNYRMSNLQAAVGLAQTERLDSLLAARRRSAGWYRSALSGVQGLTLAPEIREGESAYWMFGALVEDGFGCTRDELRGHLAAEGIETRTFFVPLHLQPSYLREHAGRSHPVAEHLGQAGLYLPSGPLLTEADVARVTAAIRRAQSLGATPSSA